MKYLPLLLLSALGSVAFAQDVTDLLGEAQRAYVAGNIALAKEKFELVRKLDPNNRTAVNHLRLIMAEEAKMNAKMGEATVTQGLIASIILPKIDFREASLAEALDFLRQKGNQISEGKIPLNFVVLLDDTQKAAKVTISLQNVPMTEVLRYMGELTGTQFTYERHAIVVKPKGAAAAANVTAPSPTKGDGGIKVEGL